MENIDMAMISEIKLADEYNYKINFTNYNMFTNVSENGLIATRGVAFLVRKKFVTKFKKINGNTMEAAELEITNAKKKLKLVTFYLPETTVATAGNEVKSLINKYRGQNSVIIAGDVNAHHPIWNKTGKIDGKGKVIAEAITDSQFFVLNTGEHTFQQNYGGTPYESSIDITICSPDLIYGTEWCRKTEYLGTDHLPIIISLYDSDYGVELPPKSKVDRKKLETLIQEIQPSKTKNIEELENLLSEKIAEATYTSKTTKRTFGKHWWNDEIARLWQVKRGKEKAYNKFKNLYTAIELKKATTKLRDTIRNEKRKKWREFMEEITPKMDNKQIWQRINILNNKKKTNPTTIINHTKKSKNS